MSLSPLGLDPLGLSPAEAAGGGATVAVPAGSLTLSGFAPSVRTTGLVSVPAGSLTLTGFAPTVSATSGTTIAIPAGALTLTGFAPTIVAGSSATVSVPAATLTITGFAPTISTGGGPTVITIPAGSLTLTAYAPKVSNGAPKFAEKLDEYPQFPDASSLTLRKLTDLFRRTNQRVNRLTEGLIFDHYAARQVQPAASEGAWGDFVLNARPVELGTGGSKYIVHGWRRLQSDWVPMRVLTGN